MPGEGSRADVPRGRDVWACLRGDFGSSCSPLNLLSTFVTLLRDSHTFSQIADHFHNSRRRPFLRLRFHVVARQYNPVVVGSR